MQNIKLVRKSKVENSFRNSFVRGKFDFTDKEVVEEFDVDVDLPKQWNIGVIVGASGTGKSTIANEMFDIQQYKFGNKSIVDEIKTDKSIEDITDVFNKVGFSSPPSWLKPYQVLSNGEKMRVDLAQSILDNKDIVVFDEFTSVVDRQVAKTASYCIQKYIRKNNKKFVAVACHYDILDWLEPDWILDTSTMTFIQGKVLPNIKDHQSTSALKNAKEKNGIDLGSITI